MSHSLKAVKIFALVALLAQCGDVESNPGPKKEVKPDKAKLMQDKVDGHDSKLEELESLIKSQAELINELKTNQVELTKALETKQVELETEMGRSKVQAAKELDEVKVALEQSQDRAKVSLAQDMDKLTSRARKGEERQTAQELAIKDMRSEIQQIRNQLGGINDLDSKSSETTNKVQELQDAIEEITEKVWELDKSWRNNLVFYGIKQDSGSDEHPVITEAKIREIIGRHLRISREVPIMRVKRTTNGPEVRGCKPITVYFEKWQDKDEILRKATLLKGANIYISEDFSKRVRDQRQELQKFMKMMRQRRPQSKFSLQYDKLIIDNEIYMFNDLTGRVEEVTGGRSSPGVMADNISVNLVTTNSLAAPLSANSERIRNRSSGSRRTATGNHHTSNKLQKSYSTESSLNHLVPNSPVHPRGSEQYDHDSRNGSPTKSESRSRNGSPVKGQSRVSNGHHSVHSSPTKKPPTMPAFDEEKEEENKATADADQPLEQVEEKPAEEEPQVATTTIAEEEKQQPEE